MVIVKPQTELGIRRVVYVNPAVAGFRSTIQVDQRVKTMRGAPAITFPRGRAEQFRAVVNDAIAVSIEREYADAGVWPRPAHPYWDAGSVDVKYHPICVMENIARRQM